MSQQSFTRHLSLHGTFYAMTAVLLLAATLRIHGLNAQGLWGDEGWSIWLARGDTLRELTMTMVGDHHGPVYSALLRAWGAVAGESVVVLRYLTVLFSVASVALIALLGREMFSAAAGVGAALAFTLMDKQVVLTQEVRDYPIVFFTMIAIATCYVRWRRKPNAGYGFAFVLATVFGLYLHYYCFMVNLAILAHALLTLRDRRAWKHFLALNALAGAAFLPWTWIVVHQFINTPVDSEVLNIHGMPLNRHTIEYLGTESFGKPIALYGALLLTGAVGPLIRTPGPMMRVARDRRRSAALLAVLWFGLPLILTAALHSRYPLLTDRNISVILPAIALLVGFGWTAFDPFSRTWIVALVVVHSLFTTSAFFVKPPWRALSTDIAARRPLGEPVLVDVEGDHAALWYHLESALPDTDLDQAVNQLPWEGDTLVISLYDYRKRFQGYFLPNVKAVLDCTDGVWMGYWGDEAKKHDVFDLLAQEGFVRTAVLKYAHLGHPIYGYRYDRASALQNVVARYGESITLRRVWLPPAITPGKAAPVLLWWAADAAIPVDYSVSVFLLDGSGALRAQHDSFPSDGQAPTTTWMPGGFVFDAHALRLPNNLPPGTYTVGVKLYTYWDGAILKTADGAEYQIVGQVTVR